MREVIDEILKEIDYPSNPYFKTLHNGEFDLEDFVETQKQFYYAVTFFSRPMAALSAKIPTPELRLEIVRNVWEEHGEGDAGKIHGNTFIEFLHRLAGVKPDILEKSKLWPETRIFNTGLVGTCVLDEYQVGASLMGMIELMFSDISSIIGRGIVKRGWLKEKEMIHYSLHEELDIKHSQDFFDILEKPWKSSKNERYLVEQGLLMGAQIFNNFYEGLYRGRKRRWQL